VVVGRNADFVEVGEGKIMWWGKGMRVVIEFSKKLGGLH